MNAIHATVQAILGLALLSAVSGCSSLQTAWYAQPNGSFSERIADPNRMHVKGEVIAARSDTEEFRYYL